MRRPAMGMIVIVVVVRFRVVCVGALMDVVLG